MNIEFERNVVPYLQCIVHEEKYLEQMAETIVPDSCPDIETIIHSYADAIIRGKECGAGSITISGGIKAGLLYLPEKETEPRRLDFYIPFNTNIDNPLVTDQTKIVSNVKIQSVEGKMVNSRKALIRVSFCCTVMAFEPSEGTFYGISKAPDTFQVKSETYTFKLPTEVSEKSFVISDSIELPMTKAPVVEIFKFIPRVELIDQKLVGNKGVFKGNVICKVLYLTEEHDLSVYEYSLPFSQYCEFINDYENDQLNLYPVLTGYDFDLIKQNECTISVSLNILVQGVVWETREQAVLVDAYSTENLFSPSWTDCNVCTQLDKHSEKSVVYQKVNGDLYEIIDSDIYISSVSIQRANGKAVLVTPISIQFIGRNEEHELCGIVGKAEIVQEDALAEQADCVIISYQAGPCYVTAHSGIIEFRFECISDMLFYTNQEMQIICGGDLEELGIVEKSPGIIFRKFNKGTSIWEIAKEYRSMPDEIFCVNHLSEDRLSEDSFLLVPVG